MTLIEQPPCYVLRCDPCGAEYDDEDGFTTHFASREELAKLDFGDGGDRDWQIGPPDLCPTCQCKRNGHQWGSYRGKGKAGKKFACCERCRQFGDVQPDGSVTPT